MEIVYKELERSKIDSIGFLWEKLNIHHGKNSKHFKKHFRKNNWEKRKKYFLSKKMKGSKLFIVAAKYIRNNRLIGFCVSSFSKSKEGEIESLFVEKEYRKAGVGKKLVKISLTWMDDKNCKCKTVSVAAGNENAFGFYKKFGFVPHVTTLVQIKNGKKKDNIERRV